MPQKRTTRTRPTPSAQHRPRSGAPKRSAGDSPKTSSRPGRRTAPGAARPGSPSAGAHTVKVKVRRAPSAPTPRAGATEGREITLPGGHEVLLTRRHFLYGAAGIAALALMGTGAAYASGQSKGADSTDTLSVPQDAVFSSNDLEKIDDASTVMELTASIKLPFGSLVWSCDDAVAACLLPTEVAKPLAQIGLILPDQGDYVTVLEHAVGEDEGFEIYDVRANSAGVIWTEADIMDSIWRVYGATLSGETLGEPQLLDEGDADWEMPTLACAANYGFWQRLPQLDGNARVENSLLKRAAFGTADVEVVYESKGRMACAPTSCGDAVIASPRARTSGTYYQLTRIEGSTGQVTDACVLPSSMRPFECGYGKTGFNFAFDGIYNYGDGIANLGTYMPLASFEHPSLEGDEPSDENAETGGPHLSGTAANTSTEAYSDQQWFHYARNPLSAPAWCGDWVMVRGQSSVCAVDLTSKRYTSLPLENGASSYGDFIASTNMGSRAITYSNIDHTSLDGKQTKHCLVRVWQPVA
ncbi:Tat pathway signal protein [Adlercreutzia sp. R21]|uniref:Tat pathway signal protein n=1 Tax=Adlercreutzia wanghongyangiae TaxID=3111451 RepID=UPI002DBAAA22|nr:Tat pathway signal protein [Adlercreutzia sp. R21]MEC4185392.1 Tat pathway signal protein [Adlercreutzia sp. R21]